MNFWENKVHLSSIDYYNRTLPEQTKQTFQEKAAMVKINTRMDNMLTLLTLLKTYFVISLTDVLLSACSFHVKPETSYSSQCKTKQDLELSSFPVVEIQCDLSTL